MRRSLVVLGVLAMGAAAPVRGDSASVTVGPETIQLGGLPAIQSDGKGSYTMDFSISGSRPGNAAPQGSSRVLPPISAPASNALTDPNEFFRNVGGRREEEAPSRRRR